ncbi:MAG: hypothetical protein EPN48_00620 [Microbacteriaceae bacterium]|nr:MAG: hypothetical protein EPN48_00620 [Microbacteriaceae bacterium]
MAKRSSDEQLANPTVPLSTWDDRPPAATGETARELGRMLLDETVPAGDIVTALRRGAPALGRPGEESPILRFRVPEETRSALQKLIKSTHRKQSDLLREGLALVIERYSDAAGGTTALARSSNESTFVVTLSAQELALLRELTSRVK